MLFEKTIIFDISSEYGHFRKFNTTSSPLTYPVPTRPAIAGILGAVLGIEREQSDGTVPEGVMPVAEVFAKHKVGIAIQLLNPVKKVNIGFNLLDTEKTASSFFNIKQRTQIEYELLKHPSFRVFVGMNEDELFTDLENRLKENQTHFSPYLGLSQFTAKLQYVDTVALEALVDDKFVPIITVVNVNQTAHDFNFERSADFKYISDTMPIEMNTNRVVNDYAEVIIEAMGQSIKTKTKNAFVAGQYGNIIFL
jgi:CRISPR-associated protein Cas5h